MYKRQSNIMPGNKNVTWDLNFVQRSKKIIIIK